MIFKTHPANTDPLPTDEQVNETLVPLGLTMTSGEIVAGTSWFAEIRESETRVDGQAEPYLCVRSEALTSLVSVRRTAIQWAADQGFLGNRWKYIPPA